MVTVAVFTYDPAILADYPAIRAGVVHATGVENPPSSPALREEYVEEQAAVVSRLGETPLAEVASILAWRRAFSRFGAKPTQYRNAAEALLRRLTKQGDVPSIGTLVDLGNLVALRHAVPVAVVDRDGISGELTVLYAIGDEPFTDLVASTTTHPDPGEVVFVDEVGRVHARRWCWRQSAQSATGPDTREVLFVIEALHEKAEDATASASSDLIDLLAAHQPGARVASWRLSPHRPATAPPPDD